MEGRRKPDGKVMESEKTRRKRQRQERKERITPNTILRTLMKSPLASHFLSEDQMPSDYTKREDYIDFEVVWERMKDGEYQDNPGAAARDIRKVLSDALAFFPPRNVVNDVARCLLSDFEKAWNHYEIQQNPERRMLARIEKLEKMLKDASDRLEKQEKSTYAELGKRTIGRLLTTIHRLGTADVERLKEVLTDYVEYTADGLCTFHLSHMLLKDYHRLKDFLDCHRPPSRPSPLPASHSWFITSSSEYPTELLDSSDSSDSPESSESEVIEERRIVASALP